MSELPDSIQTEENMPPALSHRRVLLLMATVAFLGSVAGFAFVSKEFGWGVIIGGALSFANYYWLKVSLKKLFEAALADGGKPKFLAIRYFARYLTLGAALLIVSLTHVVPVVAVILGLASFALAIVVEGFIRVYTELFNSRKL